MTNITIPNRVTGIAAGTFNCCAKLAGITLPAGLTSVGDSAFNNSGLAAITFPAGLVSLGSWAFQYSYSLTALYFKGNAPSLGDYSFAGDWATVYYLPGTTGWDATFGGLTTALWWLPNPLILDSGSGFGVQSNGFGFVISWATNLSVVVEACTNLANPTWLPVITNPLVGGSADFRDARWTNYTRRFYRLQSP